MTERIRVEVDRGGTLYNFEYTCDAASVNMRNGGKTSIIFRNGRTEDGKPIDSETFRVCYRVTRWTV